MYNSVLKEGDVIKPEILWPCISKGTTVCKTKVIMLGIRRWRISFCSGNLISSSQVLSFVYCRFFVCYRKFSTFILSSIRGKLLIRGENVDLGKRFSAPEDKTKIKQKS